MLGSIDARFEDMLLASELEEAGIIIVIKKEGEDDEVREKEGWMSVCVILKKNEKRIGRVVKNRKSWRSAIKAGRLP
jgi:hypothetical protein